MKASVSPDRTREIRGFYIHAAAFVIVNLVLTIVNLRKSPSYFWEKWVLLDWGGWTGNPRVAGFRFERG